MKSRTIAFRFAVAMLLALGALCVLGVAPNLAPQTRRSLRDLRPATHSGPIAVTPDDHFVWVVNPDNDNVAKIDVSDDENRVVAHVKVVTTDRSLYDVQVDAIHGRIVSSQLVSKEDNE